MFNDLFWFSAVVAVVGPAALLAVSVAFPAAPVRDGATGPSRLAPARAVARARG